MPHTETPALPDFIDVSRYRHDHGHQAWAWRCWGDGDCDGWLSLDHGSEEAATRSARKHLDADHTPTPATGRRQQYAEAIHATSICEDGTPTHCTGSCSDAADAVIAIADRELRIQQDRQIEQAAEVLNKYADESIRADKAERRLKALKRAHVALAEQASRDQAALERVRDAAALHRQGLLSLLELYAVIGPALNPQEQP